MRTVKQPESTAAAPLQKTKGFGEKGELSSKFGPTKYKWMKRDTNPGPVLMAVRVVTIRGKSFMLGQEPKTTVSITVKMRTVPTACALS